MVTAWSGGEVLKNIEKVLKKSWKGIKINFKIPAYTLIYISIHMPGFCTSMPELHKHGWAEMCVR